MRCNVCQSENDTYARFCRRCGTELGRPAEGVPAEPFPPPTSGADPLWAQTVGSGPGGPSWTEPVPAADVDPSGDQNQVQQNETAQHHAQRTQAQPTQAQPTIVAGFVPGEVDFATAQADLRMTVAAELAARRRRRKAVLISLGAVIALVAGIVVTVLVLGDDDDGSVATDTSSSAVATAPQPTAASVTTGSPATTEVATTVAPTTVATTVVPTTVAPTTLAPTTVVATTAVPTTPPTTAAPATTAVPAATIAPPPATTAVATTVPPPTTAAPTTSGAIPPNGDLGLDQAITKPACDGRFITLIGSSVDPDGYALQIGNVLDDYPESNYLRTELVCSSLRARSAAGDPIYVVYFGPFASKEQACRARADGPAGAYVKVLDNSSNPGAGVNCGG